MSRPQPSPEAWFHQVATHYVVAQILYHLNQAGVLRLLEAEGPLSPQEIAQRLDLTPRILKTLLEYVLGVDDLLDADESGRFGLSEFGRAVLKRYQRRSADDVHFNIFDVRVGAYGPVWGGLDKLLRGARYGEDVKRVGGHAADAVYKLVVHLEPTLRKLMDQHACGTLVELGAGTGLLERVGSERPDVGLFTVDRSSAALEKGKQRAEAAGISRLRQIEADLFEPRTWATELVDAPKGFIFSLHFHEFLARGDEAWIEMTRELATILPGWRMVMFEEPLIPKSEREQFPESWWLSMQNLVLIHHLIGNGRILPEEHLLDIFAQAGCPVESVEPINYIGFKALVVPL